MAGSVNKQLRREIAQLRRTLGEHADERLSLQALIDRVPDNLWVKDAESRFVIANKAIAAEYGRAEPADLFGLTDFDLHPPEVAQQFFDIEQNIIRTGQPMIDMEESSSIALGAKKWLLTTKVPLRNDRNEIFGLVGIARDITARKQADVLRDGQAQILEMIAMSAPLEEVLDHLMRLVESQLTGIFGSVLLLDDEGVHLRHGAAPSLPDAYTKAIDGVPIGPNGRLMRLRRLSARNGHRRRHHDAIRFGRIIGNWPPRMAFAHAGRRRSCRITARSSAHSRCIRARCASQARRRTRLIEVATRFAGIAIERKQAEDRIHFMANHDALTGLPNRTLLKDRLTQAMLHAQRYDRWVTVVFIDLDNFKFVNDSLGHNAGDELLKIVAARMVDRVRATDTVVRLGGDEFVILLFDQPKNVDIIAATLQKIRAAIAEPIRIDGHDFQSDKQHRRRELSQ